MGPERARQGAHNCHQQKRAALPGTVLSVEETAFHKLAAVRAGVSGLLWVEGERGYAGGYPLAVASPTKLKLKWVEAKKPKARGPAAEGAFLTGLAMVVASLQDGNKC